MYHQEELGTVEQHVVALAKRRVASRSRIDAPSWIAGHWLLLVNAMNGVILVGTFLAPWLRAHGFERLAIVVYGFYRLQCPQRPSTRSSCMVRRWAWKYGW